jgi:hypothetical protein
MLNILGALWRWTTQDPVSFYTAALSVFSFLLVIVSFIQIRYLIRSDKNARDAAIAAKLSADVAEKALIAANRPWVKVDIQVGGPIFFDANGANFRLKYILTNVGHSPATNVWVIPRVIYPVYSATEPGGFSPRAEMQRDIDVLKTRSPSPFGFALFPGDVIIQDITISMPQSEIERSTQIIQAIYPEIVGAVDYRIGFDDQSHQTGFIVKVGRNNVPRPVTIGQNRAPNVIWVDEGDVPAEDVRLYRSFTDGGYAD